MPPLIILAASATSYYAVRVVAFVWPIVPVAVKGVVYRAHRKSIANRSSIVKG